MGYLKDSTRTAFRISLGRALRSSAAAGVLLMPSGASLIILLHCPCSCSMGLPAVRGVSSALGVWGGGCVSAAGAFDAVGGCVWGVFFSSGRTVFCSGGGGAALTTGGFFDNGSGFGF